MKTKLIEYWEGFSKNPSQNLKRLLPVGNDELYVYAVSMGINGQKIYGVSIAYSKDIHIDISDFEKFSELVIKVKSDTSYPDKSNLIVGLKDYSNIDTFAILCGDMVETISKMNSEKKVVSFVVNQIYRWQKLFDLKKQDGLSSEEQQGLYGELVFLSRSMSNNEDWNKVIHSWVGINKEVRDFADGDWAVEIKTTSTNKHQKLKINSERQLDETLLGHLFLHHISVEVSKSNGETLNNRIDLVRHQLSANCRLLDVFNAKLIIAGYFDEQRDCYESRHYLIRDENTYEVKDDFPRIKESEIREGVGDVKYTIIASTLFEYKVDNNKLYEIIMS